MHSYHVGGLLIELGCCFSQLTDRKTTALKMPVCLAAAHLNLISAEFHIQEGVCVSCVNAVPQSKIPAAPSQKSV